MADAEAIAEAASRPTMRFVEVKTPEQQGLGMIFRLRDLLVGQRTQTINALRGHLAEFGLVAAKGRENVDKLRAALEPGHEGLEDLPPAVRHMAKLCFDQIADLSRRITEYGWVVPQGATNARRFVALVVDEESGLPATAQASLTVLTATLTQLDTQIETLDVEIDRRAKADEVARRLMTIPGIGPLIATAIATLAPPPEAFRKGRDFAAWLDLTPRQHSTGGKQRLGATTKMGERSLRRLLIIGANSVIIKRHCHASARPGTWLGRMLKRKPPMLVRVALANKMARIVWALMKSGEVYRAPAMAA